MFQAATHVFHRLCCVRNLFASLAVAALAVANGSAALHGASLRETRELLLSGKYAECGEAAMDRMSEGYRGEEWPLLKIEADLQLGHYAAARQTLDAALKTFPQSVRLRWLGHRVLLFHDESNAAETLLEEIGQFAVQNVARYTDAANRVALGRYYLHRGGDPRRVLETFYDPAKRSRPHDVSAYLAAGQLALDKRDFALAAEEFEQARKRSPDHPDVHYGLARAYLSSDNAEANSHIEAALEANPHHFPTRLLLIDNQIDAEAYEKAEQGIEELLQINPHHPQAWAYRAVLSHLRADWDGERQARREALDTWSRNPRVDHLIGRKLSQKYRFAEGAQYQRQALEFDDSFLPAQMQLSQDLLRLGEVEEGWQRANLVFDQDAYNVVAHNLVRLQQSIQEFATLESDNIILQMDSHEAAVYGDDVLALLERAKDTLCAKYDVAIDGPVRVEIFPEQQDFAIRTFGLPGGEGFLGVCFGRVITANSPASQGKAPANLHSVLWHEFCHVATLQKSRNRLPRWLSEGISVYEERQANISWGQAMTPLYRKMILGGELTPVEELSGAFLRPPSPIHLQFAYFESALVVQYLVERHGHDVLKRILTDLGVGMPINEALRRYVGSIEGLNSEFEKFARKRAESFGPKADWEAPELPPEMTLDELASWNQEHPNKVAGIRRFARALIAEERWDGAEEMGRRLIELCPEFVGSGNGYELLAEIHRARGESQQEAEVLAKLASRKSDAPRVYARLMELAENREDWEAVRRNAERMLAVNPLIPSPHRFRAKAAAALDDAQKAARSCSALLKMQPADPSGLHFRLASHLHTLERNEEAQRQVLKALEDAPRYRDAHRLLLTLARHKEHKEEDAAFAPKKQTAEKEPGEKPKATKPSEGSKIEDESHSAVEEKQNERKKRSGRPSAVEASPPARSNSASKKSSSGAAKANTGQTPATRDKELIQ